MTDDLGPGEGVIMFHSPIDWSVQLVGRLVDLEPGVGLVLRFESGADDRAVFSADEAEALGRFLIETAQEAREHGH